MPFLINIESTIDEPIRFFLNYSQNVHENLYKQYTLLNDSDRYYDTQRKTVLVTVITRIDEDVTETTFEELSFENFINGKFEDEINLSKGFISEIYKTKGESENTWAYKRLLQAFLKNYERLSNYPDYPGRELLPAALIEIVTHSIKLYENLLNNPMVLKVKKIITNSKGAKSATGYKIKTEFWNNISNFNEELISAKFIDDATKISMWYSFLGGNKPKSRINWIGEKPANSLWYFITKLKNDQVLKTFPKQQWKHLPMIFTFNGKEFTSDFYKDHDYLNKKAKDKLDKAIKILKSYTF